MDEYPHVAKAAATALADLVRRYRSTPHAELEFRFGTRSSDGKFTPGVSRKCMDTLLADMHARKDVISGDWEEGQDFIFKAPGDSRPVRARATYDVNTLTVACTRCRKMRLGEVIIGSNRADGAAVQAVFSVEEPVPDNDVPAVVVSTTMVRIRQRRCFYEGTDRTTSNWVYDFTYTWQGKNKSEAEYVKEKSPPTYEVELELLAGATGYLAVSTDEHVAMSGLLKVSNMLTCDREADLQLHLCSSRTYPRV
jgi:hypothetical protein